MYEIKKTGNHNEPKVILNGEKGIFEISGNSLVENPHFYFDDVLKWLEIYSKNPLSETQFIFNMNYFNSSTSMIFSEIFKILRRIANSGKIVKVLWQYCEEDDEILEAGRIFQETFNLNFIYHGQSVIF